MIIVGVTLLSWFNKPHKWLGLGTHEGVYWACAQNNKHVTEYSYKQYIDTVVVVTKVTTWIVKL